MKRGFSILSAMAAAVVILSFVWGIALAIPAISQNNGLDINKGDTNAVIDDTQLLAEDPDNPGMPAAITYTLESLPNNGTLQLNGSGMSVPDTFTQADINNSLLTYSHNNSLTGADSFTFSIVDEDPFTIHTFEIRINLPPNTTPDSVAVLEGGLVTETVEGLDLLGNDLDPEGQQLTVSMPAVDPPDFAGAFNLGPSGSFNYKHNGTENLTDSFVYEVCDPEMLCVNEVVTVIMSGVADIAPIFNPAGPFDISEASSNGPTPHFVSATDPEVDPGGYDTLTYTISAGDPTGIFDIDDSSGVTGTIVINDASQLDFETTDTYTLTIQVEDESGDSDSGDVIINITNVNETPVITPNQVFYVQEGTTTITPTNRVIATDPEMDSLIYQITGGDPNSIFQINNNNGDLSVAKPQLLNHEGQSTFNLTIEVNDGEPLQDAETIQIHVTDGNDPPVLNNQTMAIDENKANGANVGQVTAVDDDTNDTHTYAVIGGTGTAVFDIANPNTGQITVIDSDQLNFESPTQSYTLVIRATDSGNLFDDATITINVNDINEAPIIDADQTFPLPENSSNGTTFGQVKAEDVDAADDGNLTFTITDGNTNNTFDINNDGELTVLDNSLLDFEGSSNSFTLEITVTDSNWDAQGAKQDVENVTINLTNVNEAPTIPGETFSTPSNALNGTVVGRVRASDPDAGTTLTFQIVGGNTGTAFAIDPDLGDITVIDSSKLNHQTKPTYMLSIRVTDDGSPNNLFTNGIVTINIGPPIIYEVMLPIVLNNFPTDEPNNNCNSAFRIHTNNVYSFEPNDNEDWYKFTLTGSKPTTVVLSNYFPVGQIIAYSGSCGNLNFLQNNGNFTPTKTLNLGTLPAGTYYVRIVTDPPYSSVKYNLQVNTP